MQELDNYDIYILCGYPSLGIPSYGNTTPVEGASVLSVHGGDFSALIVILGGL